MEQTIPNCCLVNISWFWIRDVECVVWTMNIASLFKILMEKKDVIYKPILKLLNVRFMAFTSKKLLPRQEQILDRNDILECMLQNDPPRLVLPVIERLKTAYILWHGYHDTLPKTQRYTLGNRIDSLFIDTIEAVSAAVYLNRDEKLPYIRLAIRKTDTVKLMLIILWETKSLDTKKYATLSEKIDEVGRMLGGWSGQLTKTQPRV